MEPTRGVGVGDMRPPNHAAALASYFEPMAEEEPLGLDANSQILAESPSEDPQVLGELPPRYHFSAPVIHVV